MARKSQNREWKSWNLISILLLVTNYWLVIWTPSERQVGAFSLELGSSTLQFSTCLRLAGPKSYIGMVSIRTLGRIQLMSVSAVWKTFRSNAHLNSFKKATLKRPLWRFAKSQNRLSIFSLSIKTVFYELSISPNRSIYEFFAVSIGWKSIFV